MIKEKVIEALERRGYTVRWFETGTEAADYLNSAIDGRTVGFGDSMTLESLKLFERLSAHNQVTDPQHRPAGLDFWQTARRTLLTDVFLTSVNAMAETGEMVNIDGTGNRVAGSLFGHEKVYFVVGINKIVPTLEEARFRARQIAAPANIRRHGYRTPCAAHPEKCWDCASPDRICCGEMIYHWKMRHIEMEVVLIHENLGL